MNRKYANRPVQPLLTFAFVLLLLLLTACGGQSTASPQLQEQPATESATNPPPAATASPVVEPTATAVQLTPGQLPPVDPLAVQGNIVTAGSSTVYPLSEAMAARFEDEGYAGQITIDSIGSGAGFERFCVAGESDIANASRPINASEIESCLSIGREPLEFRVGTDALAITISTENDFVTDVTLDELALIFSTAESWSDVRSEWPAQPILRYIPGTDSGTFDYFVEEIFDQNPEPILNGSNLELSEDDNVLALGVLGSPYAIGFFGYAYYQENRNQLDVVSIEGVEPSQENVENGSYALARPLFIYSDANVMQQKPQVAAFINFYLTFVNDEVIRVGYFPASDEALDLARQAWLSAMAQ